jgi:hypothetical protein
MNATMKRLVNQLKANRRQAIMLSLLMSVALFMWGRLVFKSEPKAARADVSGAANDAAAPEAFKLPAARPVVEVAFADRPSRDLFAADPSLFPQKPKPQVEPPRNSVPEKSEEQKRAELLAPLKALKLSTVLVGERPQALIDGRIYAVNQQPAAGFTIVRITGTSVFLKHEQLAEEFELKLYEK